MARNDHASSDGTAAAKLAAEQRRRWSAGQPVAVEELLSEFDHPSIDSEELAQLAFAEFQFRQSTDEALDPADFLSRFPTCVDWLTELFQDAAPDADGTILESSSALETADVMPEEDTPDAEVADPDATVAVTIGDGELARTRLSEDDDDTIIESDIPEGFPAPVATPSADERHRPRPAASDATGPRFKLGPEIARGGMGRIIHAHDERIRRDVAYKKLLPRAMKSKEARSRFVEEAQVTGQLEHSGIVPIYEMGIAADGAPFYAMKLVRGETFEDAIDTWRAMHDSDPQKRVEFNALLRHFIDICNTMAFAHNNGVLHRDLKPQNVMLGEFGETLVLDWGLAKVLAAESEDEGGDGTATTAADTGLLDSASLDDADSDSDPEAPTATLSNPDESGDDPYLGRTVTTDERLTQTRHGRVLGTPAYMSPEQAMGDHSILDARTDVYALGAILYRMLTGRTPVGAQPTVRKAIRAVREGNIKPVREISPGTPRALEAICQKALKLDRDDRYPSAIALKKDVEAWLADEPVSAYPEPLHQRAWRFIKRHRLAVAATVAVAFTAIVVPFTLETMRHIEIVASVEALVERADEAEAEGQFESAQSLLAQAEGLVSNEPELSDVAREVSERRRQLEQTLRDEAIASRNRAVEQSLLAEARRLVAESRSAQVDKPRLSLLLAAQAVELSRYTGQDLVPAAVQNLHDVIGRFGGSGLHEHTGPIQSLAMSNDGRWLLSGSADRKARLWVMDGPIESVELFGHEGAVTAVLITPDGRYAVTAGEDAAVALWDVQLDPQPDPAFVLLGHKQPVTCMAVSPDSRWLATSGLDTEIRVWDLMADEPDSGPAVLLGHSDSVNALRFSPDGSTLFSGSDDRVVAAWAIPVAGAEPEPLRLLVGHESDITSMDLSADGKWLASGDSDGGVSVWNTVDADSPTQSFDTGRFAVTGLSFSPDGSDFAVATANGTCLIWTIVGGACEQSAEFDVHAAAINDLLWLTSPVRIVTASDDRTVHIQNWPSDENDIGTTLRIHEEGVSALTASDDGRQLVGGSLDGSLQVWDTTRADPGLSPNVVNGHSRQVQQLELTSAGRRVATVSTDRDHSVRLWQHFGFVGMKSDGAVDTALQSLGRITAAAWHPTELRVVLGGTDGQVVLVDPASGTAARTLTGLSESVTDIRLSWDGTQVAAAADNGQLAIWTLAVANDTDGKLLAMPDADLTSIAWAPDDGSLAVGDDNGGVYVVSPGKPGSRVLMPGSHDRAVNRVAFSPDGKWLASVSDDKTLRLWSRSEESAEPTSPRILLRHTESVYSLIFTPDSRHLVTVSDDSTAVVWPIESENSADDARLLEGHEKGIRSIALLPDGSTALTGSDDGTVRMWDLSLENPSAASVLIRNFGESVRSLSVEPVSSTLFAGTRSGRIAVWPLDIKTMLSLAKDTAGRSLTESEALQFEPDLSEFEQTADRK